MLNGMEFQTVGAAYLKALRPTAVLVNGSCRKLCDADRRVLEGVLRLMNGERYAGEPVWSIRYVTVGLTDTIHGACKCVRVHDVGLADIHTVA